MRLKSSIILALLLSPCLVAGETVDKRMDKIINLDLWGKSLSAAISSITEQSGIDVRVNHLFISPKDSRKHILYLQANQITTRMAIEWVSRALGCRYVNDAPGSIKLTGGYEWVKRWSERRNLMFRTVSISMVDSLLSPGEKPEQFKTRIQELVKVLPLLYEKPTCRIERQKAGGNNTTTHLVVFLPTTLKNHITLALKAMDSPGIPVTDLKAATISKEETVLLRSLQKKVVVKYTKWPVKDALSDLALKCGIEIGFDQSAERVLPKTITLNLVEVTARKAIEQFAAKMGLKGYELWAPGTVWLTRHPSRWNTAASRKFHWEDLQVKGYAAAKASANAGGGKALAHHIRRKVMPELWSDPCTAVVFHPKHGNLVVVAPEAGHNAVQRELAKLIAGSGK